MIKRLDTIKLGDDYEVIYERPGYLIQSFMVLRNEPSLKGSICNGFLDITLSQGLDKGYKYYTLAPKSDCGHYSLYNTNGRSCRRCEYEHRSSSEFLNKRKIRERTEEKDKEKTRLWNRSPNGRLKNKRWRSRKDAEGNNIGLKLTNEANKRYHASPEKQIIIRDCKLRYRRSPHGKAMAAMYSKRSFLATPPWEDGATMKELLLIRDRLSDQHIDHYIPLAGMTRAGKQPLRIVSGLHCRGNWIITTAKENLSKGAIPPEDLSMNHTFNDVEELRKIGVNEGLTSYGNLQPEELELQIKIKRLNRGKK